MERAIELARRGKGWTNPNPLVGAVIVKDGRVIGEGYHARCGEPHAERNAIAALTEPAEGADLYVTLEPCCHQGKTPPCTEAILEMCIRDRYSYDQRYCEKMRGGRQYSVQSHEQSSGY